MQYQCDLNLAPSTGITIDSAGVIYHNGSSVWYECLVNDLGVYNIYTADTGLATKCQTIKLTTEGGNCAASSAPVSTVISTVAGPVQISTTTAAGATVTAGAQTVTAPASACSPSTVTFSEVSTMPAAAPTTITVSQAASTVYVTAQEGAATVTETTTVVSSAAPVTVTMTETSVQSCAVSTAVEVKTATATVPTTAVSTQVSVSATTAVSTQVSVSATTVEKTTQVPTTAVVSETVTSTPAASTEVVVAPTPSSKASSSSSTVVVVAPTTSSKASSASTTAIVVVPTTSSKVAYTNSTTVVVVPSTSSSAIKSASTSTATLTSTAVISVSKTSTSTSASATATGPVCPNNLSGEYQYPHLIVPVNSAAPNKTYGTQYFATINSTTSTIFNFDIPQSYENMQCQFFFTLPAKSLLETSDYTLTSGGSIAVSQLSTPATQATSYNNVPSTKAVTTIPVTVGTEQVITSGPCAAGQTLSYEFSAVGGLDFSMFVDWNPCPLGVFITAA